jgi:hypothetical protein
MTKSASDNTSNNVRTLTIRIDFRIKLLLLCVLMFIMLNLEKYQWLYRYDYTTSSIIYGDTTTKRQRNTTMKTETTTRLIEEEEEEEQQQQPTSSPIERKIITRTATPTATPTHIIINDFENVTNEHVNTEIVPTSIYSSSDISNNNNSTSIIVVLWNHWTDLEKIVASIWGGNLFCSTIQDLITQYYKNYTVNNKTDKNQTQVELISFSIPIPTIHFHIELSCYDLYTKSKDGTGNYIQAIYMMRLAIKYIPDANIKLNITCLDDTKEFRSKYVLPWFTGVWYSPNYYVNITRTKYHIMKQQQNKHMIHLQGQPSPLSKKFQQFYKPSIPLATTNYCGSFQKNPTAILYHEMQYDVRRMAIGLACNVKQMLSDLRKSNEKQSKQRPKLFPHNAKIVHFLRKHIYYPNTNTTTAPTGMINTARRDQSLPKPIKETYLISGNQQERLHPNTNIIPLLGNDDIDFDDAVIHFRCGDLLSTNLPSYGFLTFNGYSRHIDPIKTRSIGIVTQPFRSSVSFNTTKSSIKKKLNDPSLTIQERELDTGNIQQAQRCKTLVYALVDYLQEQFPNVTITIRNDPKETIALVYVRMVMAQQSIAVMSTFSTFPTLGTFGTGYYLRPRHIEPSSWLVNPIYPITAIYNNNNNNNKNNNNIILFDEKNMLVGSQAKDLWDKYGDTIVLEWFRTGKYNKNNFIKSKEKGENTSRVV